MSRHTVVVDLGYGDAGKGTIVDWLCADRAGSGRPIGAVIRFNGGAQAGHTVVMPDHRQHTFAQFGAGTLRGVRTHLSRYTIVDPLSMAVEADHLASIGVADPWSLLTIDRDALLCTPFHQAANRARERARGTGRHGSCGMGVGEAVGYALAHPDTAPRVGDIGSPAVLGAKLEAVRDGLAADIGRLGGTGTGVGDGVSDAAPIAACLSAYAAFAGRARVVDGGETARLLAAGDCVFEGAQGVLLDEWRGFHPYTTWSTTTVHNAMALLAEAGAGTDVLRLGVVRTYTTRHGAGPLVTEDPALAAALPDRHNRTGAWQGAFRVGHFDAVAHRYAVEVCGGIDALAVTHADAPGRCGALRACYRYSSGMDRIVPGERGDLDYQAELARRLATERPVLDTVAVAGWPDAIAETLERPVLVTSHGPTAAHKRRVAVAAATGG